MTIQTGWNSEYNTANGTLLIGNGSRPVVGTLTAGPGIGIVNGAGTITINNTGGGGIASLSPYIVGDTGSNDFATIGAAILQAVADGASTANQKNIYIKPKSGGYVENITLADGVNLIGFDQLAGSISIRHSVVLVGNITFGSGTNHVCNMTIAPAAPANALIFNGTVNPRYHLKNLAFDNTGPSIFEFLQTTSTAICLDECYLFSTSTIFTTAVNTIMTIICRNSIIQGDAATSVVPAGAIVSLSLIDSSMLAHFSGPMGVGLVNSSWLSISAAPLISAGASAAGISAQNSFVAYSFGGDFFTSTNAGSSLNFRNSVYPSNIFTNSAGSNLFVVAQANSDVSLRFRPTAATTFHGTYSRHYQKTIQTVNAAATTVDTVLIPIDTTVQVFCQVNGLRSDFAAAVGGTLAFLARNTGGVAAIVGAVSTVPFVDAALAGSSFTATASGANVDITVTGLLATTINWSIEHNDLYTKSNA